MDLSTLNLINPVVWELSQFEQVCLSSKFLWTPEELSWQLYCGSETGLGQEFTLTKFYILYKVQLMNILYNLTNAMQCHSLICMMWPQYCSCHWLFHNKFNQMHNIWLQCCHVCVQCMQNIWGERLMVEVTLKLSQLKLIWFI